jgi:predicted nucleic acid-binding protein
VSVLALGEALTGAKRAGSDALALRYRDVFLRFPNLNMYSIDVDVVERMAGLRATCGLPTPDAIHLASAIAHGARAFLTNDARLKRAEGIEVLLHSDWVTDNEPR